MSKRARADRCTQPDGNQPWTDCLFFHHHTSASLPSASLPSASLPSTQLQLPKHFHSHRRLDPPSPRPLDSPQPRAGNLGRRNLHRHPCCRRHTVTQEPDDGVSPVAAPSFLAFPGPVWSRPSITCDFGSASSAPVTSTHSPDAHTDAIRPKDTKNTKQKTVTHTTGTHAPSAPSLSPTEPRFMPANQQTLAPCHPLLPGSPHFFGNPPWLSHSLVLPLFGLGSAFAFARSIAHRLAKQPGQRKAARG